MIEDTIPGVLYRLSVFEFDGTPAHGFPKIYGTERRFKAAIKAQENSGVAGRTWIKEGCARGPWVSLEGPVVPELVNHWSEHPGPHLPPRDKSWLETERTG